MTDEDNPLDTERIDLDAVLALDEPTELYPSEDWLDIILEKIEAPEDNIHPTEYDDETAWMIDELRLLFVRAHLHTDMDVIEFSSLISGFQEYVNSHASLGLDRYAQSVGRADDLADGPLPQMPEDDG